MSMYLSCGYCGENGTQETNFSACANPEHIALAKKEAQISFDATSKYSAKYRKKAAILLATEVGLPKDHFLKQIKTIN